VNGLDPVATFRLEARDLLEQVELDLLTLAERPDDRETVDAVFRGLHTLKGSGAMFGFDALAAFTHHCETAFDRVRKGEVAASPALIAAVLAARDHMRTLAEGEAYEPGVEAALLDDLHRAVEGAGSAPVPTAKAAKTWRVRFSLPPETFVNGGRPLPLLDELRDLGACDVTAVTDAIPAIEDLVPTDCRLAWDVVVTTDQPRSAIEDVFIFVIDDMTLEITEIVATPQGDVVTATAFPPNAVAVTDPLKPANDAPQTEGRGRAAEMIRVPAERLDELMDRVGELVIAQSRLSSLPARACDLQLRSVSEEIERLSGELRDTMMVLRMVPVGSLFGRFRRLVHDLARETGKVIELVTEGRNHGSRQDSHRTAGRSAGSSGAQLDRPRSRNPGRTPRCRQGRGRQDHAVGPPGRWRGDHHHQGRRPRHQSRTGAGQGRILRSDPARRSAFGSGPAAVDLCSRLLDGGASHQSVRPRCRHGRGQEDGRDPARCDRYHQPCPGQGSDVSLRIPLTLAIIDGLLVRVGTGRYVIPLSAVEECLELSLEEDLRSRAAASSRCATACTVPAAARSVSHRNQAGRAPEGRGYLDRDGACRHGRRPDHRRPPDGHQVDVEAAS
jgi:two-component system chemotaxis sensor kinase CheA